MIVMTSGPTVSSAKTFGAAAPGIRLAMFSAFFTAPLSVCAGSCRAGRSRFRCTSKRYTTNAVVLAIVDPHLSRPAERSSPTARAA